MSRDVWDNVRKFVSFSAVLLGLSSPILGDCGERFEFEKKSDLACGKRIRNSSVLLIDLHASLDDRIKAVATVHEKVPNHGLESPIPLLLEIAHTDGKVQSSALLREAIREAASRGCDLVIVLDFETVEKVLFRPQLMELKLPVSYVLVLLGSQVRNSARVGE